MAFDPSSTTQDALSVIIQNYNAYAGQSAQLNDVDFGFSTPVRNAASSDVNDTVLVATPVIVTPTRGKITLRYKRMDLSALVSAAPIERGAAQTVADIVGQVNARYGINLVPADYENDALPADGPLSIYISAASLLFTGQVNVTLGGESLPRPVNDDVVNAIALSLTSGSGSIVGHNVNATAELDEEDFTYSDGITRPALGSVWYRFEVEREELLTLDTLGSSIDTVLRVFVRNPETLNLSEVQGNDNITDSNVMSSVAFYPQVGQQYFVSIDQANRSNGVINQGDVTLNWYQAPALSVFEWVTGSDITNVVSPNLQPVASYTGAYSPEQSLVWFLQWSPGTDGAAAPTLSETEYPHWVRVDVSHDQTALSSGVGLLKLRIDGVEQAGGLVIVVGDDLGEGSYESVGTFVSLAQASAMRVSRSYYQDSTFVIPAGASDLSLELFSSSDSDASTYCAVTVNGQTYAIGAPDNDIGQVSYDLPLPPANDTAVDVVVRGGLVKLQWTPALSYSAP